MPTHEERVEAFINTLKTRDNDQTINEYYHTRSAAMLASDQEADLRSAISREMHVNMRDVMITGSAKLGFNLVGKPNRPSLSEFCDTSDIDVVIISTELFVRYWRETSSFVQDYGPWSDVGSFRKYLARGWMRPDKLPKTAEFPAQREWFDFYRKLTESGMYGPYKITAGIYFDDKFWTSYASTGLETCRKFIGVPK